MRLHADFNLIFHWFSTEFIWNFVDFYVAIGIYKRNIVNLK